MGDLKYVLSSMHKSLGPVIPEYENIIISALHLKTYQLSGIRNIKIGEYLRELEEMHLPTQAEEPAIPLTESDKNKFLNLIHTFKQY